MGLDIFVLIIIGVFVIMGFVKGLAKTLLNLIATVLAFVAASVLSSALSAWVYDTFFKEGVIRGITDSISESGVNDVAKAVAQIINGLPRFVANTFEYFGLNSSALNTSITKAVEDNPQNGVQIIEGAISPIFVSLISIILIIIIFIVLMVILNLIIRLVENVFKLPVINEANKILGGILGIFQGAIAVLLIISILKFTLPMNKRLSKTFNEKTISDTYIFKYFYNTQLLEDKILTKTDLKI